MGYRALVANTTGTGNTAIGASALVNNGNYNIAIGYSAGLDITGDNNIIIGNQGLPGESDVIRIGYPFSSAAYLYGIYGKTCAGCAQVFIDSNGHLGTDTSSRRFKEDIRDIGAESDGLMKLRPPSATRPTSIPQVFPSTASSPRRWPGSIRTSWPKIETASR